MDKRRRTPQEKKALSYNKDTRGHYYDSPNVKFSRKLNPIRKAQENRRRRRVYNARTEELAAMDEDVVADIEAGELEQNLGRLGKREKSTHGAFTLHEHVDKLEANREDRQMQNTLRLKMWRTCPVCGRPQAWRLGDDPDARAAIEAGLPIPPHLVHASSTD